MAHQYSCRRTEPAFVAIELHFQLYLTTEDLASDDWIPLLPPAHVGNLPEPQVDIHVQVNNNDLGQGAAVQNGDQNGHANGPVAP